MIQFFTALYGFIKTSKWLYNKVVAFIVFFQNEEEKNNHKAVENGIAKIKQGQSKEERWKVIDEISKGSY